MELNGDEPSWCLTGSFKRYKMKNDMYTLSIDTNGLIVSCERDGSGVPDSEKQIFRPSDLIGCVCMRSGPKEPRKHLAFFTVYAYPLLSATRKKKRTRVALTFMIDKEDTYEKNLEIACSWRTAIYTAIRTKGATRSSINRKKKLLLIINPNSGPGKAHQIYKRQVAPILGEAEVPHEILVTKAANHALNLVKTMDLDQYAGLVIISGDGLLYEVYNGLLSRPDWEKAIEYPVGVVPGGSGNGLARSLSHYFEEPYLTNPVLVSTLNLAHGFTSPMDLVLVQTPDAQRLSFLSIGLGLIADIDIESERLRSIGESRFTVWAIARIANLRRYHAKIHFKRSSKVPVNSVRKMNNILQRSQTIEEGSYGYPEEDGHKAAHLSRSCSAAQVNDESSCLNPSLMKVDEEQARKFGGSLDGSSSRNNDQEESLNQEKMNSGGGYDSIPKLQEPVPDDWEFIEDDFVAVYACYQSHIGTDVHLAPDATLNDGIIWLLMVNGSATKASVVRFLLGLDGSHINIPGVDMIPVVAFRIEPSGKAGYLTVDGEVVPWGPLQAQILPSKGQIITR